MTANRTLAICAVLLIASLYVVGYVSHGVLRHIVQTAIVWPAFILGLRDSRWTKWVAFPCLLFWLFLMVLIWLFLLGWVRVINGTFSPVEIAMTCIIGLSSIVGIVTALRTRTSVSWLGGTGVFLLVLAIQIVTMWISFLPGIAHD